MANPVFKALGHPLRRQVLSLLRKGPKSSGELADVFDAAWPTVSRHLTVLRDAELITAERQGNSILYRVNTSVVEDAVQSLLELIGRENDYSPDGKDLP